MWELDTRTHAHAHKHVITLSSDLAQHSYAVPNCWEVNTFHWIYSVTLYAINGVRDLQKDNAEDFVVSDWQDLFVSSVLPSLLSYATLNSENIETNQID